MSGCRTITLDYSKRVGRCEAAAAEWRRMSCLRQRVNAAMSGGVTGLRGQGNDCGVQLRRFSSG
ncbi:MbeD family mobilization/exclusion protein [Enterobacter hormaechei]|uniref:MbeD family mobilization/exclusion protein n=1 Tax=Enterobacter hormaechei TaxID=158836 RepID=UPI001BCFE148|nr:MbeD family mobilization/exclusion protein [Enterobacter hormaechei]